LISFVLADRTHSVQRLTERVFNVHAEFGENAVTVQVQPHVSTSFSNSSSVRFEPKLILSIYRCVHSQKPPDRDGGALCSMK
jgi:hypothetical protein